MIHLIKFLLLLNWFFPAALTSNYFPFNNEEVELNTFVLKGNYPGFEGDELELVYWKGLPSDKSFDFAYQEKKVRLNKDGDFGFQVHISDLSHISLMHRLKDGRMKKVLSSYIAEPGDDIILNVNNHSSGRAHQSGKGNYAKFEQSLTFAGKGSEKFVCQYKIQQLWEKNVETWSSRSGSKHILTNMEYSRQYINRINAFNAQAFEVIDQFKGRITSASCQLLEADVFGENMGKVYYLLSLRFPLERMKDTVDKKEFLDLYRSEVMAKSLNISEEIYSHSTTYPSYLLQKMRFERNLELATDATVLTEVYTYSGLLRERLLTEYLVIDAENNSSEGRGWESTLDKAIETVSSSPYREALQHIKKYQTMGSFVQDFQLLDKDGNLVKLSNYRGKVVFLDFWFTGCTGCKHFYKNTLSKAEEHFEDNDDVVFISISIDVNKERWIKSLNDHLYTSALAVNLYTNGQGADHPVIKQLSIRSFPALFVIDREGRIFNSNTSELQELENNNVINSIERVLNRTSKND